MNWIELSGALIPGHMPHNIASPTEREINLLLKRSYFVRWNSSFDTGVDGNFWYVIKDSFGGFDELSKNTRNQVRKGLKNFNVKKIDQNLLISELYYIYNAASQKYNSFEFSMTHDEYLDYMSSFGVEYDFYGVFDIITNELVAYSQNLIEDRYCFYEEMFFNPKFLKKYCSYALIYEMNRIYLEDKKFLYIHDGSRSLSHETKIHELLINKFKFRKAYSRMEIRYRLDIKILCFLLYPFRKIIYKVNIYFFNKFSVLLRHEGIVRGSYEKSI